MMSFRVLLQFHFLCGRIVHLTFETLRLAAIGEQVVQISETKDLWYTKLGNIL